MLNSSDEQFVMSNKEPWQLSGGEEWNFYVDYVSSLERKIPKELKFKLKLSWIDVYNELVNKEIEFTWFSEQNSWRWNNYGNK
jgi:exonuclease III